MSRIAEQSARLDVDRYPARFCCRTVYSDMDVNRHLNNGTFGRLFEEGRVDLHHRVFGAAAGSGNPGGCTLLLATITMEFLREGQYPGSVEVATAVMRVGRSSFELAQAAFQDGGCIALADCVMVKAARGREVGPVPLTEAERKDLARLAFTAGPGADDRGLRMSASGSGVVSANGIQIAYETSGDRGGRPLLMVMGLGSPMQVWHPDLCELLAGRDFFVIRFDNRDVGRSTHLHDAPQPDIRAVLRHGDVSSAAYTLDDLAADGFGLLDALGLSAAHVLGASMGGMIAQTMAARRPERVLSLTSIMSTPSPTLANPTPQAAATLMRPPATSREASIARALDIARIIGSPGYPPDNRWRAELAGRRWDQGLDPAGAMRQWIAMSASGDRTEAVRGIQIPTLVVHGDGDPLINVTAGRRTAELIKDAELMVVPGMGHDLPRPVWPALVQHIVNLLLVLALVMFTAGNRRGG